MYEFVSIVGMTAYLNESDTRLQGKYHLIDSVFDHVMTFLIELELRESHLKNRNYMHFPSLLTCSVGDCWRYVRMVSELKGEFDPSFWLLLIVNLIFDQQVSKCLSFTGLTGLLPCLHQPALGRCAKLFESLQSIFLRSSSLMPPPFRYSPLNP
jgi:hypothetical protein